MAEQPGGSGSHPIARRAVLAGGTALGALGAAPGEAAAATAIARARPEPGDWLAFDGPGERKGQRIALDDLPVGGAMVPAVPLEPKSGTLRNGSRLNKLVLLRLEPSALDERTREHAAQGVVAYSAVCTHQGCTLNAFKVESLSIACFCHHSEFAATEAGAVLVGPARRRLPMLPIGVDAAGGLVVTGEFTGRPGFDRG